MANFAIAYDLIKRKDYPKLWEEMTRLGAHKVIRDHYFLAANNTVIEIKNHLKQFVDDDDRIVVIQFDVAPSFTVANKGTNDWIEKHC